MYLIDSQFMADLVVQGSLGYVFLQNGFVELIGGYVVLVGDIGEGFIKLIIINMDVCVICYLKFDVFYNYVFQYLFVECIFGG